MIRDPWHSRTEIITFVNKTLGDGLKRAQKYHKEHGTARVTPNATVPAKKLWFFAEGHANNVMSPCHHFIATVFVSVGTTDLQGFQIAEILQIWSFVCINHRSLAP